ncbi:hypothetical protein HB912_12375 [Listeria aquatica]|uniref:Uncharacterized protein n=1 Tax=Listeria aquatica TaxID=1494960 RepID=A0A841ZSR8_9LIST|nr:hypothetical protein [Listeria aquatica]MBC1522444.1 hypothetical protein [Listeria aquatica]
MKFKDCTNKISKENLQVLHSITPSASINFFAFKKYEVMRSIDVRQNIIHLSISNTEEKNISDFILRLAIKELTNGLTKDDFQIYASSVSDIVHLHHEKGA